jgi:Zn-dependent oligopeptidase
VADEQGTVFASLYVDQDARPGKRGGAWMAQARPRLNDGNVQHVPVAYVVCNFAPTMPGSPLLIGYKEIMTLLHKTGHCLHHLFPQVDRPNIAGTHGFEWDAIELPSQLMEDFAWHRFPHAFTHIFAGGYASGYYSYLWAEVLAADGFRRFAEAGLIDRSVAARFCMEVLSRGASRPAADSFRAFRGRDADPRAMLVRHGLTTDAH